MATRQVKTARKTAPAARSNPIRKTAGKPKAAPALKLVTTNAANKEKTATSAPNRMRKKSAYWSRYWVISHVA